MKTPTDEIERLNFAATAELISRGRWLFSGSSLLLLSFAIWSSEPISRPFLVILIVSMVFATAGLWSMWRFRFYITALSFGALAIACVFISTRVHDKLHFWIFCAFFWGLFSYTFWGTAGIVATVYAPGWESERSLVRSWWQGLITKPRNDDVIEFSWFLYTFRLLKSGQYWATTVGAKHSLGGRLPYGFAVQKLADVEFMPQPDGKMKVRIGKRTFKATNITPPNPVGT